MIGGFLRDENPSSMNLPSYSMNFPPSCFGISPARLLAVVLVCSSLPGGGPVGILRAQESLESQRASMKIAARAVRASTVTIRVDRRPTLAHIGSGSHQTGHAVAVFSGVLVKKGFVVTPLFLPDPQQPDIRITLPDGRQTTGRPRILDEYSGLALLAIDDHTVPSLSCCETSEPRVGDCVVNGAAWGRQQALVSFGMISGIGYRLPSSTVEPPPMIVCDIRAAQTSKGSGVVAANGRLIGVVMAISRDRKWTYVVPASHIQRLFRSLAQHEKQAQKDGDEILVLKRQVPRLGMRLEGVWNSDQKQYEVFVKTIVKKGPGDLAGLRVGDRIHSVNGRVIRAVYDVGRDFVNLQPGDRILLGVERDREDYSFALVLGGGFAASGDRILRLSDYIQPEIRLSERQDRQSVASGERQSANQLVHHSRQNLALDEPSNEEKVQQLLEQLKIEKSRNRDLEQKVERLEKRFEQLLQKLEPPLDRR